MTAEITPIKQRGKPFLPGQSGNPLGRPKGARNRATLAAEAMLDGEAEALTRKAIEMALAGDVVALRICMDRLLPHRKDRPLLLELPELKDCEDVQSARSAIIGALAGGTISLAEATAITELVETFGRHTRSQPPSPSIEIRFVGDGNFPVE